MPWDSAAPVDDAEDEVELMNPTDVLRAAVADESPAPEEEIPDIIVEPEFMDSLEEGEKLTQEEFEEASGEAAIAEAAKKEE